MFEVIRAAALTAVLSFAVLAAPVASGNVFVETATEMPAGVPLKARWFLNCSRMPDSAEEILAKWHWDSPQLKACGALVELICDGRTLSGFHIVQKELDRRAFEIRSAAHVVGYYNRILAAGAKAPYLFQFASCQLKLANSDFVFNSVSLGEPQFGFSNEANRTIESVIKSLSGEQFSSSALLGANDRAVFPLTAEMNSVDYQVLARLALVPFQGDVDRLLSMAPITTAGHFGPGGPTVAGYNGPHRGASIGVDGRLRFWAATVNGMSGGPIVARTADDRVVYLGTITAEWRPSGYTETEFVLPGSGNSSVLNKLPGRENIGVR